MEESAFVLIEGVVLVIMGIVLMVAYVLPVFLKPKPWVWIYDLVLIGFGTSSLLFLPFCIPLIIYWVKPETRAYFGRAQ